MKLLFDKKTRRMVGSIEGSTKGLPTSIIAITGTMPTASETAYLNSDNVTVTTKALTAAEKAAKASKPSKATTSANPMQADRVSAYTAIDTAAGNARLRHVTSGPLQQQVYDIKAAEAAAYIAAGYPTTTTAYPLLTAQATAEGKTVKAVADNIMATKAKWLLLAGTIEGLRLTGKAKVSAAKTIKSLNTATAAAIQALDKL